MAVSKATAARAVERWELARGRVSVSACRCRFWVRPDPVSRGTESSRQVYYCEVHRYRGPLNVRPQNG